MDRGLSRESAAPAAEERVEIGGYDYAAGTGETAEVWKISWVFVPVAVEEHDVIVTF